MGDFIAERSELWKSLISSDFGKLENISDTELTNEKKYSGECDTYKTIASDYQRLICTDFKYSFEKLFHKFK